MTLEPLERQASVRNCVFVPDWICQMEVEEIPLEVCRLCVEARKIHASNQAMTVKRRIARAKAFKPTIEPRIAESESESLSSLDRLLMNDKISLEEYLQRRGEAVKRLQEAKTRTSTPW